MSSPPSPLSAKPPRVGFVDAARTLAMLLMVQGHVCDTLLDAGQRATALYAAYSGLRGLTAALFFLLSGFAVVVASDRHWESYRRPGPRLYARLRRVGVLLLLGHLLQMPRWSGAPPFDFTRQEWTYVLRCGVLDCVAWSMLVGHLLLAATPSRRVFATASAALAFAVMLVTPRVASYHGSLPLGLAVLLRTDEGSLFPLFPFLAHFFLGAAAGRLYLDHPWFRHRPRRLALLASSFGAAMWIAGAVWLSHEPWRLGASRSDMALFLLRTGKAWVTFAGVTAMMGRAHSPGWLRGVASNALSIYVLHLVVLYGAPGVAGLLQRTGETLLLSEAFVMGPALLALCAAGMALWDWGAPRASALGRSLLQRVARWRPSAEVDRAS